MICEEILGIPPMGALNLHGSHLPEYRGRAPVNWAILDGATETGLTLHYMVRKPDAGDIVLQRKVSIELDDTAESVFNKLVPVATEIMREALPLLREGKAPRIPQDHSQATYFGARRPADGAIQWGWPAKRVHDLVRAVTRPYPGAFAHLGEKKVLVWKTWPTDEATTAAPGTVLRVGETVDVACGEGVLQVIEAQVEGEGEIKAGTRFGDGRREPHPPAPSPCARPPFGRCRAG